VNPEFFYASEGHEAAFKKMVMTIEGDISLGLVHGVSGTGKTLTTQMLLAYLRPEVYETVLVLVTPGMSKTALLREILRELFEEMKTFPAQTQKLLDLLASRIFELYHQNRKLVILIDEAHFLSAESLHLLRTISNLETPQKKLTTTILFAEDHFLRRLAHPSYQSLKNRMYMKLRLSPINADETAQYIKYRLLASGSREPLFDEACYGEIHKYSGGVCREINRICHNCLTEAFMQGRKCVDGEIVHGVVS
jgi:general secretion pathway protein A